MYKPNYSEKNIVNLMSSIASSIGSETGYNKYHLEDLEDYNHIILIVVDGLGYNYLMNTESFLKENVVDKLEGAFPLTTAASNTAFSLGVPVQQHGLTGWFVYLKETGAITTVLPFTERYWGSNLAELGFSISNIMNQKSMTLNAKRNCFKIMDQSYAFSSFSKAVSEGSKIYGEESYKDYFSRIKDITKEHNNTYIHTYIGDFDHLGHEIGVSHPNTLEVFKGIDNEIKELSETVEDALIIVTADHGMLDTDDEHIIRLNDYPEITDCMSMPLSGDTRIGYCYLRNGFEHKFGAAVNKHLGDKVFVFKSQSMIDRGWFGEGEPHDKLKFRVGDYTLIAKGKHVLYDNLGNGNNTPVVGHHSGISDDEVYVPLVLIKR